MLLVSTPSGLTLAPEIGRAIMQIDFASPYAQVAGGLRVGVLTKAELMERLIHLAPAHPESAAAAPSGTSRHATFLQWMVFLSANVYEAVLRMYYSERYSARGAADAEAVRQKGTADFCDHLALISLGLGPYVMGSAYSLADVYLYMLVSWYPGEKSELYSKAPKLAAHARLVSARPAVVKVEADHA